MSYKRRTPKNEQSVMGNQVVRFNHRKCIVKIDNDAYLTDGVGDPPRTLLKENAKIFSNKAEAEIAIIEAIKTHPYRLVEYKVEEVTTIE